MSHLSTLGEIDFQRDIFHRFNSKQRFQEEAVRAMSIAFQFCRVKIRSGGNSAASTFAADSLKMPSHAVNRSRFCRSSARTPARGGGFRRLARRVVLCGEPFGLSIQCVGRRPNAKGV